MLTTLTSNFELTTMRIKTTNTETNEAKPHKPTICSIRTSFSHTYEGEKS